MGAPWSGGNDRVVVSSVHAGPIPGRGALRHILCSSREGVIVRPGISSHQCLANPLSCESKRLSLLVPRVVSRLWRHGGLFQFTGGKVCDGTSGDVEYRQD